MIPVSTSRARVRASGLLLATLACGLLCVGYRLEPNRRRVGTHQGLGLPPCGFLIMTGLPCPTCGMTTAFAQMMHGQPWAALRAQPAGVLLFAGTVTAAIVGVWMAWRGRWPALPWERLVTLPALLAFGFLFFGAWAWKIVDHICAGPGA